MSLVRDVLVERVDRWIAQDTAPTAETIISDVTRFLATAPFDKAAELLVAIGALHAGVTGSVNTEQKGEENG